MTVTGRNRHRLDRLVTELGRSAGLIRNTFGYDDAILADLNHAAIDASFAPTATKATLHRKTGTWPSRRVTLFNCPERSLELG